MKRFVASLKNYSVNGMAIGLGAAVITAILILFLMVSLVVNAFIGAVAHAEDGNFPAPTDPPAEFNLAEDSDLMAEAALLEEFDNYLEAEIDLADECPDDPTVMVVTGDHVRLRSEPNTNCKVVGHKNRGDKVNVVKISNGWAELSNGEYISADYLTEPDSLDFFSDDVSRAVKKYAYLTVVVKSEQTVYYFVNGVLNSQSPVTTARNGYVTPTGMFEVCQRRSNFDMKGKPEYHVSHALFLKNLETGEVLNIAFHDATWEPADKFGSESYRKRHGSAGCIRTPEAYMDTLWSNLQIGAKVLIVE